ncbi:ABC transporter permease subunit [Streptomyces tubercidicus]|uniref:ABC transporter permease n=1 Tax=Streptomyces tubercidicus TaxID=47759 RepID=UPI002E12EEBA|nr:ABC transporter permease subunit [Streptomyces tubercidicus]WSX24634.1 ABC transporter permease subunit [Streptomyces tubercidicus]
MIGRTGERQERARLAPGSAEVGENEVIPENAREDSQPNGRASRPRRARDKGWRGGVLRLRGDGWFVVPAVGGVVALLAYPTLLGLYRGFTDWQPGVGGRFVGLENFASLFSDPVFWQVLRNSVFYLVGVPVQVLVPLMIALMLYERVPKATWFRTVYLFPLVFSPAILGLLFQSILNPDGMLNRFASDLNLGFLSQSWLDDPGLVKPTILGVALWGGLGVNVLIFHAALSSIPTELFEAAEIDGASWWKKLRHIMIPGILPVVLGLTFMGIVDVFVRYFALINVLTKGGPNNASASTEYDLWSRTFEVFHYGAASAEAGVLLVLVATLVLVMTGLRRFRLHRIDRRPAHRAAVITSESAAIRKLLRLVVVARTVRRNVSGVISRATAWVPRLSWSPVRMVISLLILAVFVLPMLYLVSTSVKTKADFDAHPASLLPSSFTLEFVREAWQRANLGQAMLTSLVTVAIAVTLSVLFSLMAAFWMLRHPGRSRAAMFGFVGIFYFLPGVVWVIPLNSVLVQLGLGNNILVLGVVQGVVQIPFGVALMSSFLIRGFPMEVLESASLDGANLLQQFFRLVVPLAKPGIAALASLAVTFSWGDFLLSLVMIQDPAKFPATLAVTQLVGRTSPALQVTAAAGLISFIPLLLFFALAQRAMVRGINSGVGRV